MAFDPKPTNVIASWSEDGTNVTFPIASVPEMTADEADAVNGDSRKCIYALLEKLNAWYTALDDADKPGKLTVNRNRTLLANGNIQVRYDIAIELSGDLDVAPEN